MTCADADGLHPAHRRATLRGAVGQVAAPMVLVRQILGRHALAWH